MSADTSRDLGVHLHEQNKHRRTDMTETIVVALIGGLMSLLGAMLGVVASAKLTNYRIEQLEKKVEKHNNLVERMTVVEQSTKSAHHRLDELTEEVHHV